MFILVWAVFPSNMALQRAKSFKVSHDFLNEINTSSHSRINEMIDMYLNLFLLFFSALAGCYFPLEFQGEFLTQSMLTREIAYTSVSVLFDSVPSWGQCHRRLGKHIILKSGDEGQECFKCVSMVARSVNVLQVNN